MSRQVNFFADAADFTMFLGFVEREGFLALPDLIASDTKSAPATPPTSHQTGSQKFHLLPPGLSAAEAFYDELTDDAKRCRLMIDASPVIEVLPSRVKGTRMSRGRIYFSLPSSDALYKKASAGYNLLARFLSAWELTDAARVGPHTHIEVSDGRLVLVDFV